MSSFKLVSFSCHRGGTANESQPCVLQLFEANWRGFALGNLYVSSGRDWHLEGTSLLGVPSHDQFVGVTTSLQASPLMSGTRERICTHALMWGNWCLVDSLENPNYFNRPIMPLWGDNITGQCYLQNSQV